jgi:acetyltransferase-like isoleucine patch superfamily enzyme
MRWHMHPVKYLWAFRAVRYKASFGHVGKLCYFGKPCFIEGKKQIFIGDRVRVFPGIRLETIHGGSIAIGNNVAIEQNVEIIAMDEKLSIGNDVTIAGNVFITNEDHQYQDIHKSVMEQGYNVKTTKIEDGCFIGYGAVLLPGTHLGSHCVVGSNAVLKGEYPANSIIVGAPGKIIKEFNTESNTWEKK